MKITFISTSDIKGGAAIAAFRLFKAFIKDKILVNMLVLKKKSNVVEIINTSNNFIKKIYSFLLFAFERLVFSFYEKNKSVRFAFSIANTGRKINKYNEFTNSEIIHLHWFNQGFISLKCLNSIFSSGKPVVWTLHDMWAFTGGCHYSGECINYLTECKNCPLLKKPSIKDLSNRLFHKKREMFQNAKNLYFTTCSNWLKNEAQKSPLISKFQIFVIPNTIDVKTFTPLNNMHNINQRLNLDGNKNYILFGSFNINDERKGFSYLLNAITFFSEKLTEQEKSNIEIIVFGKMGEKDSFELPFKLHAVGSITSEKQLVQYYNISNLFILPSLQDNLPNTILEALSCGTPVVAFNSGGISDMIDHKKNGYLAKIKSAEDLANGIYWILFNTNYAELSNNARQKVLKCFNETLITKKFLNLYQRILPVNAL